MNVLAANLKHYYQRRGLWYFYAIVGLMVVGSSSMALRDANRTATDCLAVAFVVYLMGLLTATLVVDVVARPFSFCLPGHRSVARTVVFAVGLLVSVPASMVFLVYEGPFANGRALTLCAVFFLHLLTYFAGISPVLVLYNAASLIGFLPLLMLLFVFLDLHVAVGRVVLIYPLAVISVSLTFAVANWRWLGRRGWVRRYCGSNWMGTFDAFNPQRAQVQAQQRQAAILQKQQPSFEPYIGSYFLDRMRRYAHLSRSRYLWGVLYTGMGVPVFQWKPLLFGILTVTLWSGFVTNMGSFLFVMMSMVTVATAFANPPLYSTLLLPAGRPDRFVGAVLLIAVITLGMTVFVALAILLSIPMAHLIPVFRWRGLLFSFTPLPLRTLLAPLVAIPLFAVCDVLPRRKAIGIWRMIVLVVLAAVMMLETDLPVPTLYGVHWIAASCLFWAVFIFACRRVALNRPLAGQ